MVETYGIKVDKKLHQEILDRYEKLKIAPYAGFINPKLVAVKNDYDKIIDILHAKRGMGAGAHFGFI